MKKFRNHTLKEYLDQLAAREPVPGGGSAAALTAAMGAGLISMVARYSIGRKGQTREADRKFQVLLKKSEELRSQFLALVDLDAQAYLKVVKTRKGTAKAKKAALKEAEKVPLKVCRFCYQTIQLAPALVEKGNPYLVSDVEVACDFLLAAFRAAMYNVEANRK